MRHVLGDRVWREKVGVRAEVRGRVRVRVRGSVTERVRGRVRVEVRHSVRVRVKVKVRVMSKVRIRVEFCRKAGQNGKTQKLQKKSKLHHFYISNYQKSGSAISR